MEKENVKLYKFSCEINGAERLITLCENCALELIVRNPNTKFSTVSTVIDVPFSNDKCGNCTAKGKLSKEVLDLTARRKYYLKTRAAKKQKNYRYKH